MKTELKAKFIQHIFRNKKKDEGFTLIELLVVIIIIGILSAIALPSFLNQANKAKQSEAKTYIGSMNRAQQAQYMEAGAFVGETKDLGKLGLGVRQETGNYQYEIKAGRGGTGVTNQARVPVATAPLKAYIGGVQLSTLTAGRGGTGEATTLAILCEADVARGANGKDGNQEAKFSATNTATGPTCNTGYSEVK